jgi:choline dehydrogenase-like flavoprotein
MAKLLPKRDAVIIGLGWTGAILAQQLTEAGLNVVAIERGPWRDTSTDFNVAYMQDELRYAIRKELFLKPSVEAMTMRNTVAQTAMPMRDYGSFLPGDGVGGAGVHWNGQTWRFWSSDFSIRSHLAQRCCKTGASPGTRSSPASTNSNISAAFPARPAISRARSCRAAIPLKARAAATIPRRR